MLFRYFREKLSRVFWLANCELRLINKIAVLFVDRYATILAFDVKIERDAQELADSQGVKIFQADIIYHLFDKFTNYREELKQRKRDENKHIAVFPCKLKILPQVCIRVCFLAKQRDKRAKYLRRRELSSAMSEVASFLTEIRIICISVRIQLEGSDRDGRDGRGWNRQGRNATLRPEQRRELTLFILSFLSISPSLIANRNMRLFVSFASLEYEYRQIIFTCRVWKSITLLYFDESTFM